LKTAAREIIIAVICAVPWIAVPASGQVSVEGGVSTDTIDVFSKNTKPEKSGVLAMCASLVLPGLGQQYLGQNNRALAYFSAEALFVAGAFFCDHYSRRLTQSARAYAWEHANVTGGSGADGQFWQDVGNYDQSDGSNQSISKGYNNQQELIYRSQEHDYLTPNLQWQWDDPLNRKKYGDFLKRSTGYKVASSFFLGALVLDRLVSFVDARFSALHQSTTRLSSMHISPRYDPRDGSSGVSLSTEF
jgi:hypothetical protein